MHRSWEKSPTRDMLQLFLGLTTIDQLGISEKYIHHPSQLFSCLHEKKGICNPIRKHIAVLSTERTASHPSGYK